MSPRTFRALSRPLALVFVAAAAAAFPAARAEAQKRALTVDDYTKWKSINASTISPDGKWVAYVVAHMNTTPAESQPVLHLLRLDGNQDIQIANATSPAFSSDARWLAYEVDSSGGRGGRGGRGRTGGAQASGAAHRVELRNLATGAVQSWQDMQSFTFASNAGHIILRRRAAAPAGAAGRGGGGAPPAGTPGGAASLSGMMAESDAAHGSDVILHDLATGRDQLLGSVGDIAFNKTGDLLAYTVDASPRDGNGLFVVDLAADRTTPIDNDARIYSRLAWNDAGTGVAVLKGLDVGTMRERQNVLVVFPDVRAATTSPEPQIAKLDATKAAGFPYGFVVSDRAPLDWSRDGKRVFFGIKEQIAVPDTSYAHKNTDEVANVDVWNSSDPRIQSVQMIRADADRNFTYREAFDVGAGRFVRLADSTMRQVDVSQDGRWAVGRDDRAFISDYKRPAADVYRVNTSTGERTLIAKDQLTGPGIIGISADGKEFVFWKNDKFQAYDLDAGTTRTLGGDGKVSFVDVEYDHPGPKPSYGIDGYTADGKGFVARGDYDLYFVPFDGGAPVNLTKGLGAKSEIRYRYAGIEPDTAAPRPAGPGGGGGGRGAFAARAVEIDLSKPVVLSTYGEWTKKAGFSRLEHGQLTTLVYDDVAFNTPVKAAKADVYLYRQETFEQYPDLRVADLDFKNSKKISDVNPQQAEYNWGHRILFDFKDKDGHRLQGILALPDDYKPGEKRPMLVNFYEKNSQNLHRYSAPSYLTGMGSSPMQAVSDGYITMLPDVYYHTGSSHSDQLNAVENAVKKVIAMGYVDPKHIGLNGHSYGGEGAAFIATRSRLFAAVGVGAGVTDLFQDFNQNWGWSYQVQGGSGANGDDYYLYGQGRWGFSPWDKPQVYMSESALSHVPEVTEPILIEHGTADPTVAFQNGLGFYNALRYNGKNAILLAYLNEGHGLRGLANRKDLTIRYFQFFDHYLKGAPAPEWMTKGVPFLKKAYEEPTQIVP